MRGLCGPIDKNGFALIAIEKWRLSLAIAILALVFSGQVPTVHCSDILTRPANISDQSIERFAKIWSAESAQIVTFYSKAKMFMLSFPQNNGPDEAQVDQWIATPQPSLKWLEELKTKMSTVHSVTTGFWGNTIECFRDSVKIKNAYYRPADNAIEFIWVFDGKHFMRSFPRTRQVDISEGRSSLYLYDQHDFGIVLPARLPSDLEAVPSDETNLEWRSPNLRITATAKNAFVSSMKVYDNKQTLRMWKKQTAPWRDSAIFGQMMIEVSFLNGRATRLTAFLTNDLKVNPELDPSTFVVPVKPNDKVFDFRADPKSPKMTLAKLPYDSVSTIADEAKSARPPAENVRPGNSWSILQIAAGFVFVLATLTLLSLYRRRKLTTYRKEN